MITIPHLHRRRTRLAGTFLPIFALLAASPSARAQAALDAKPGDIAAAADDAVKALKSAAKDSLLVKDVLGSPVTGPGGDTVGHVENLVVVPGGRVVAAIVATGAQGKDRLPVPFSLVKVSRKAGKLGLALPVSPSELKGMKEVQSLAGALPSVK